MSKKIKVLPDTISQLESLKLNSESFITDDDCDDDQIWKDDIVALDNAIEIIKAYEQDTPQNTKACEEKKIISFMIILIVLLLVSIPITIWLI